MSVAASHTPLWPNSTVWTVFRTIDGGSAGAHGVAVVLYVGQVDQPPVLSPSVLPQSIADGTLAIQLNVTRYVFDNDNATSQLQLRIISDAGLHISAVGLQMSFTIGALASPLYTHGGLCTPV